MKPVWVAYDHTVHYLVDIENEKVLEVEIPGWMNTFESPGSVWNDAGVYNFQDLTDDAQDAIIEVLENSPMPEPYWG